MRSAGCILWNEIINSYYDKGREERYRSYHATAWWLHFGQFLNNEMKKRIKQQMS